MSQTRAITVKQTVLPCPFCGSPPEPFTAPGGKIAVVCRNEACGVQPSSRFPEGSITPARALAAWNTRIENAALVAERDALREALKKIRDISNCPVGTSYARAALALAKGE